MYIVYIFVFFPKIDFVFIKAEEAARAEEDAWKQAEEQETEVEENPWWKKYADKYQGSSTSFEMGETTPPPEEHVPDEFPKAYMEPEPVIPEPEKPQEPVPEPELPTEPEPKCPFCYNLPNSFFSNKDELQEHMKESHNVVIKPKPKAEKKIETGSETVTGTGTVTGTKQTVTQPEPVPTPPTTEEKSSAEFKPERVNLKRPVQEPVPEPEPEVKPERVNLKRPDPVEPVAPKENPELSEFQRLLTEKSKRSLSNLTEKLMGKSKVKKMKTKKAGNSKNKSTENPANPNIVVQDANQNNTNNEADLDEEKENIASEKSCQINSNSSRKRPLEDREVEGQQFKIIFIIIIISIFLFIIFFASCAASYFFGFFCWIF